VPLALFTAVVGGASAGILLRAADGPEIPAAAPSVPVTHDPSVPVTPPSTTAPGTATNAPVTVGPETAAPPVTAFLDGRFYVSTVGSASGVTLAPGTYRSVGLAGCAWERQTGSDIAQDRTADVVTIRLRAGDFFRSEHCGPWTRTGR